MHIGIIGPIDTANIADFIDGNVAGLPRGYPGAPLLGTLIGELLQRGHRVSAFTSSSDMPVDSDKTVIARHGNFSIEYCPMRPRAWRPNGTRRGRILDFYRFERASMERALRLAAPDVVHAHWAYEFALSAIASEIPHVITCHDSPFAIARMNSKNKLSISAYRWLRALMGRKALQRARCVTAVSPYMRDAVQNRVMTDIAVVPNPVDALASTLYRKRSAPTKPALAMVCNGWDARKNPQPALRAFAQFHLDRPESELHLYGHDFGPGQVGEDWCKQQAIAGGMVFHGAISHHDLLKSFSEFDMLVHPSIEESFGMVIAEAMAMGLPVVAGAASGAVPWVLGDAGALCDIRDPVAIRNAIDALLVPAKYESASLRGNADAQRRFLPAMVADQYIAEYERALRHQRGDTGVTSQQTRQAC